MPSGRPRRGLQVLEHLCHSERPAALGHSGSFLVALSPCSPVCFRGPLMSLGYSQHPARLQGFGSSKAIFPVSRHHTRTAAWVILLQKHLH